MLNVVKKYVFICTTSYGIGYVGATNGLPVHAVVILGMAWGLMATYLWERGDASR